MEIPWCHHNEVNDGRCVFCKQERAEQAVIEEAKALLAWSQEDIHQVVEDGFDEGYATAVRRVQQKLKPALEALQRERGGE